jgi:exodeoxyribonuclease VII large subunit
MQRSNYQLVVEQVSLAGMGALLKMLEERKKKLAAEGLFDPARKQLLPYLPQVIGVVTSPTGAVIRDILHRLADRFPRHVLIWPVLVQGADAAEQIAAAIKGFNDLPEGGPTPRPDLLIVARGGGSIEDLMPFNEEIVVRAAAASEIPLISAVGHETDTTLIDFASDVRAPTPTAAAEMAVPVREDLLTQITETGSRLRQTMRRAVEERRERLSLLARALGDPARAIEPIMQRLDERAERLVLAWQSYLERRRARLAEAAGKIRHPRDVVQLAAQRLQHLDHRMQSNWREGFLRRSNRFDALAKALQHLSPMAVLGRGYTLIQSAEGQVITSAKQAKAGDKVSIRFHDGQRGAAIDD